MANTISGCNCLFPSSIERTRTDVCFNKTLRFRLTKHGIGQKIDLARNDAYEGKLPNLSTLWSTNFLGKIE